MPWENFYWERVNVHSFTMKSVLGENSFSERVFSEREPSFFLLVSFLRDEVLSDVVLYFPKRSLVLHTSILENERRVSKKVNIISQSFLRCPIICKMSKMGYFSKRKLSPWRSRLTDSSLLETKSFPETCSGFLSPISQKHVQDFYLPSVFFPGEILLQGQKIQTIIRNWRTNVRLFTVQKSRWRLSVSLHDEMRMKCFLRTFYILGGDEHKM